ncbi:MAG: SLAC1 anion channel family protein [Candidatus Delongbacteria bacterium]|nr:SLAC1 anion channel family protein [Candidatus Delongbacteria bacterium]MBN2836921.1 SLAC1 anion channel family protein [Candidatus Delongbacteria bacterium]
MKNELRLKFFPISFFSVILGLTGFTIALQKLEPMMEFPKFSNFSLYFTNFIFIVLTLVYFAKLIFYRSEVLSEFNHPIKLSFFPAFSISFLLFSVAYMPISMPISKILWIIGVILHLILTVMIIKIWIHHSKFEMKHMNPAWFIPAVGNIIVPVAGVAHSYHEISWFFFSIGLLFWIILLTIFFNRIIFHHPLPEKLLPTLFILIAPPAVGFISIVKLTGELNDFSKILYYFALFLVIIILAQIEMFMKIKYYLSWWAYTFPVSAITIASILMFHETKIPFFKFTSLSLFVLLVILLIVLFYRTIIAIIKKEICIEED